MVIQYKCPSCGDDMVFNSDTGMLTCPSCQFKQTMKEAEKLHANDIDEDYGDFSDFDTKHHSNEFHEGEVHEYQCHNCGAVLVTTTDTTATTCNFCGSPMILSDRLSGKYAPAKIIPFSISKQKAQESFKHWCKKGLFTPKDFKYANRIKSISGLYVPFWLYDINGQGDADAVCTRVRTYSRGEYIYTETSYYDVYRKVDLNYCKIPCDASEKMNDQLMDKLEPFNYSNLKEFEMPYLAGYTGEKYNYTDSELFPRVKTRIDHYMDEYIRASIKGYSTVHINNKNYNIRQKDSYYTYLPVWMVCYDYKDSEHTFAMNGQTGKIVGKPPISYGKVFLSMGGIAAACYLISSIIAVLGGGGFL